MHRSYEQSFKHKADFRVKYRFRSYEEGGRRVLPYQGLRCDFSYADEPHTTMYMIFPEFEDEIGQVILDDKFNVPVEGTALMWIVVPERRYIHKQKIVIGTKCYFREGPKMTADCEVVEILGLFDNPIK
jgi:hypothetical protein